MPTPLTPLESIDLLVNNKIIPVGPLDDQGMFALAYAPIREFIDNLRNGTKPETAAHDLFRDLIRDVLKVDVGHEVRVERGAVDFMLRQENANPIAFELKPPFQFDREKLTLYADKTDWKIKDIQTQVQKYLKSNEYVILTDLRNAYLFNRMALVDYKPFETLAFTDLVYRFVASENMWDSIRRIEDQTVKVDLDKSFFEDLKKWYDALDKVSFIIEDGHTKKELIVLLLNKIIFIKTLEDYGLVNFRHLLDEYDRNKDRWYSKGSVRILEHFFEEIEEFFYEYYNTELFEVPFWKYVLKTDKNAELLLSTFEQVLGTDNWARTLSQGMVHYNYRQIDEDIFGKAYETFIAEEKKDEGIYYTPKSITAYMAKKLIVQLFGGLVADLITALDKNNLNIDEAYRIMHKIESIKIIDPTSGSGSFLIKVIREIYMQYQRIIEETDWVKPSEKELFSSNMPENYRLTMAFRKEFLLRSNQRIQHIARIILLHIYAIDKDERALDTAKANMWKEAIKLHPQVYNYRKLKEISHILPNLGLNFATGDSLAEIPFDAQMETLGKFKTELAELHSFRDAYLSDPFNPELVQPAIELKRKLYVELKAAHPEPKHQLFFCLEFFQVFFDKDGSPLDNSEWGFDGAISNPPWEALKPVRKEYANIDKGSQDIVNFSEWFKNELESKASFKQGWEEYKKHYAHYSDFLRSRYTHQGKGDPNFYKYFLERDIEIVKQNGSVAILIQSGFQTDVGCKELRDFVLRENTLEEISSFENKGYEFELKGEIKRTKLFPDVHPQFKFSILLIEKRKSEDDAKFDGRFYLHHPDELYSVPPISYSLSELERFSPINLAIMEFRSERDREICDLIRGEHPILRDIGYRFYTEIHMTNDNGLFIRANTKAAGKADSLPVFEGKMIHQYRSDYDEPRFFINRKKGDGQVRRKIESHFKSQITTQTEFRIDSEEIRLGIRAIARTTDERTIIASLLPSNTFVGNSLICLQNFKYKVVKGQIVERLISRDDLLFLLGVLNSLTLNYYIRNKISANVSISFLYEMPIPKAKPSLKTKIVDLSRQILIANDTKGYFAELATGKKKLKDVIQARAELEVLIARDLYGLKLEDWEYLTSTFTFGSDSTREELDSIISASRALFV